MKVSKKVGRRKHSRSSSISRRRLRSKKSYKKNSYRKKNAKTQKGGKRGRGYKRARTYKRGKRFHRGGDGTELGNILLEYKKNDGGFLTSSDNKMFRAIFFKDSDELHLRRCSGNTTESCSSPTDKLLFILRNTASTLADFNDRTSDLVLEARGSIGNSLGVNYTFFANTLNKNSFSSLLPKINNLAPEPSNSPLAPTIFRPTKEGEEEEDDDPNPAMAPRIPR
jgi:hypothetical protein